MTDPIAVLCRSCGRRYELTATLWRCACGGLLDLAGDAGPFRPPSHGPATMWRYADALPFGEDEWRAVSLGEGMTPLVRLGGHPSGDTATSGVVAGATAGVVAKLDYLMPTLSFKDRGAVTLVAAARRFGARRMVADSSGNAGTAIAAYAARAGIGLDVFVPSATSPKKAAQITAHGATLHRVDGDRAATAAAAIAAVEESGAFYASHVYNPLFVEGVQTYAFELVEQLDGRAPDLVVLPVGNGTLLLGAYRGFRRLHRAGVLDRIPPILAVQAAACAPVARAFAAGESRVVPVADEDTLAEGIAITAPPRGEQILAAIRSCGGRMATASEDAIAEARRLLAAGGLYVEPTAAAPYAGLLTWLAGPGTAWLEARREAVGATPVIALPLCGAGLKAG